jgi:hypothetical protein
LRPAAAALFVMAMLLSCTQQETAGTAVVSPHPAQNPAADLRTQIDLLFAEHVMIVAKETAAAVNHSDEYAPYTTLLGANATDLSAVVGRAYGSTTASRFRQRWDAQNGYLVDYAIGVVSHNDDKASAAMAALQNVQLLDGIALKGQAGDDKTFIDDLMGQKYTSFYADLHLAYAHTQATGDAVASQIVKRFPDKFPGRIDGADVAGRVAMNLLLQEHSYLATMSTDAAVAKRDAEKVAAVSALATSAKVLRQEWLDWDRVIVASASGADPSVSGFAGKLMAATGASLSVTTHYVQATVKVVDDQKAKTPAMLATDDRAAATATQPIADALG